MDEITETFEDMVSEGTYDCDRRVMTPVEALKKNDEGELTMKETSASMGMTRRTQQRRNLMLVREPAWMAWRKLLGPVRT